MPSTYFLERCTPEPNTGCWLWLLSTGSHGYGNAFVDGKNVLAHRGAWVAFKGPIPVGMEVLHSCDQPSCINPGHLFLGTQADNMADMVRKGRTVRGEARAALVRGELNAAALLNAAQVAQVRELYAAGGLTQAEIGQRFGIARTTVGCIVRQEAWAA